MVMKQRQQKKRNTIQKLCLTRKTTTKDLKFLCINQSSPVSVAGVGIINTYWFFKERGSYRWLRREAE
jgi:hypothetical protein